MLLRVITIKLVIDGWNFPNNHTF